MLKDDLEKSRNYSGILFIFALLVVYGGTTIPYGEGVWFYYEMESFVSHFRRYVL